jgi:hypothetical protein
MTARAQPDPGTGKAVRLLRARCSGDRPAGLRGRRFRHPHSPPLADQAVPAVGGTAWPGRREAGHAGAPPGLPCLPPGSGLGLQSQRLEQRTACGALLDRFEKLIQAPASLTEQVAGLVEEG